MSNDTEIAGRKLAITAAVYYCIIDTIHIRTTSSKQVSYVQVYSAGSRYINTVH